MTVLISPHLAYGQTWSVTRAATSFDRYSLTAPVNPDNPKNRETNICVPASTDTLENIKANGNLGGVICGTASNGVTGWFDYDIVAPQTGWYEWVVGGFSDGEHIVDPDPAGVGLTISGGGFSNGTTKVSNIWLTAGAHTLRLQKNYWVGFKPISYFTLTASDTTLAQTVRVAPIISRKIHRLNECGELDVFSGGNPTPKTLTMFVNDAPAQTVNIPASVDLMQQQINLPCQTLGSYSVSFGEAAINKRDIRVLTYEVIDATPPVSRPGGEIVKTLTQEIDCVATPPDYSDTGGTRVLQTPLAYRESGTGGWLVQQQGGAAASWFAYRLSVTAQQPYLIEVDYPDDALRTFAIALRESDPVYYPVTGGVDSGGEFSLSKKILTHTLVYWPRATDTRIAFLNAHAGRRGAACSKIRVYAVQGEMPAMRTPIGGGRQFVNWYEEGNSFVSIWGMPKYTYPLAIDRWAKTIAYMGGDTLSPTVAVYHNNLYPSAYNESFGGPGIDDTLRRILLASERLGMKVLPELHPRAGELAWPDLQIADPVDKPSLMVSRWGTTKYYAADGIHLDPPAHYNPLYPANQDWYVNMIGELVDNYADSPALLGVNLRFMQWANPTLNNFHSLDWGYDDYTVGLFKAETGSAVPFTANDTSRTRFASRYAYLTSTAQTKEDWIAWRCNKIAQLYTRIRDRVRQARTDLKVYTSVFDFYPSGHGTAGLRDTGLDPSLLAKIDGVELVNALHAYGRRYDPVTTQGTRDNLLDPSVLTSMLSPISSGKFMPYARYLEATDVILPPTELGFANTTDKTWMSAVVNPAGRHFLERYAVSLAETDASWLGDGGNGFTIGQPLLREFTQEYRQLPPVPFTARADARDPAAVWELAGADNFLFYAVNRERYPVTISVYLNGANQVFRLSNGQGMPLEPNNLLRFQLMPYQLLAFRSAAGTRITGVAMDVSATEVNKVTGQVVWLEQLAAEMRTGTSLNPGQMATLERLQLQARDSLNQRHLWRARTLIENHELLPIYDLLKRYPPYLRDNG